MRLLIAAFVLALAIAGCAGKGVVGKWQYDVFGQSVVLDLKEDKSFTMGSSNTNAEAGTYTVEGKVVTLNFGDPSRSMVLTLDENGDTLTGSIGALNVNLKRMGNE